MWRPSVTDQEHRDACISSEHRNHNFFCLRYNVRWNTMFLCLAKASSSKDEIRSQKSNQIKGCKWLSRYHFVFCGSADSQNFQFFTTSLNNIDSQIKSSADKWKYLIQSIRDSCITIITKENYWNFYFSQKKARSCHAISPTSI